MILLFLFREVKEKTWIKKKHTRKVKRKEKENSQKKTYDQMRIIGTPQPTEIENINYIKQNRRGRATLWREYNVNICEYLPFINLTR